MIRRGLELVDEKYLSAESSPLDEFQPLNGAVGLYEKTGLGELNLRGQGRDFMETTQSVLGFQLPVEPNTTAMKGDVLAVWLGPDEWLLEASLMTIENLNATLNEALREFYAAVTEVTDQLIVVCLTGVLVRDILNCGCPLDFHPHSFELNMCAQSHYFKAGILINQIDEIPSYDIRVHRSYAEYLWTLLMRSIQELSSLESWQDQVVLP